jgi:hypothetical protein
MRFSRSRRLALALPFGWLARLLGRSDVTTTMYAASNGGGRLGPAAALVGLCLSGVGVGAGAACVMSGALPAPPIIAHIHSKPKPETPKKQVTAAKKKREPARPAEPISVPHTFMAKATPTATPAPRTPRATVSSKRKTKTKPGGSSSGEFGFEGSAGDAPSGTSSGAVASASSAGSGGRRSSTSKTGSAPKDPTGGEFGFEGG